MTQPLITWAQIRYKMDQNLIQNAAVAAIRRHFDVLADSIASIGPERVIRRLSSRGLLSEAVLFAPETPQYGKALLILNAMEKSLSADPIILLKFLKTMKREKLLQSVTTSILKTYSEQELSFWWFMIKRVVALSILCMFLCTGKIQGDLSESPLSSDSEDFDIGELQVGRVMCVVILPVHCEA